jgi:hypothetical protein
MADPSAWWGSGEQLGPVPMALRGLVMFFVLWS